MICKNTNPCFFDMLSGKAVSCQNSGVKPGSCLQARNNNSTVVCKDVKSTVSTAYSLSNPNGLTVAVVQIDDYVIKNVQGQKQCDFAFLIGDNRNKPIAILIELKGTHTDDALKQMLATLEALKNTWHKFDKVYGRIVGTKTPDIRGSGYQSLKKNLQRDYNGDLNYQRWKRGNQSPNDTVTVGNNGITL